MKKCSMVVFFLFVCCSAYSQKNDKLILTLSGKFNLHRKDVVESERNYLKAMNTVDFGVNLGYNQHLGKKLKTFLGVEGGIVNTRYSFDFEPNIKELGFDKFSGANDFKIKTSILAFRGALKLGRKFRFNNGKFITISGGFIIDISAEKYAVKYLYASEDINSNVYLNIITDVFLGSSSSPDLSQFIDVGLSNFLSSNGRLNKLNVGFRLSGKLLCNCGGGGNKASAKYFDSNNNMFYNSFDDKKTSIILYVSYPLY